MSMPRGKKIETGYATVVEEDGQNYRQIADKMTEMGYQMNHASARNFILRAMKKFAEKFAVAKGEVYTDAELDQIARSPSFQSAVSDIVHRLSAEGQ